VIASVALAAVLSAAPAERFAFVVGSDLGLDDEPRLQFAQSDAEAVARTWLELGLVAKGIVLGAPLRLSVEPSLTGRVPVTSSGANELSFECTRLSGSPFAQALIWGLRGAADSDGDGRVTLSELYGYLRARTLAVSLPAGGQHASWRDELAGSGEGELRLD
jgi:hypothetical protein